jgi:hypothetical protein
VKPIPTDGFTATALIVSGSDRETISLAPQAENLLKGDAKNPIAPDATITLTIKTAKGKLGQVKIGSGQVREVRTGREILRDIEWVFNLFSATGRVAGAGTDRRASGPCCVRCHQ